MQASAIRSLDVGFKHSAFVVSRDGIILWVTKSSDTPFMTAFTNGTELPRWSAVAEANAEDKSTWTSRESSEWSEDCPCVETQYFDHIGEGYQYTCIEFLE